MHRRGRIMYHDYSRDYTFLFLLHRKHTFLVGKGWRVLGSLDIVPTPTSKILPRHKMALLLSVIESPRMFHETRQSL